MRSLFRILLAVVAAYATATVVGVAGSALARMMFEPRAGVGLGTAFLSANAAINLVASVLAGYLCARLAPPGRILASVGLLALVFLAVAIGSARLSLSDPHLASYLPLVTLLDIIGLWTGAMTERAIHAKSNRAIS